METPAPISEPQEALTTNEIERQLDEVFNLLNQNGFLSPEDGEQLDLLADLYDNQQADTSNHNPESKTTTPASSLAEAYQKNLQLDPNQKNALAQRLQEQVIDHTDLRQRLNPEQFTEMSQLLEMQAPHLIHANKVFRNEAGDYRDRLHRLRYFRRSRHNRKHLELAGVPRANSEVLAWQISQLVGYQKINKYFHNRPDEIAAFTRTLHILNQSDQDDPTLPPMPNFFHFTDEYQRLFRKKRRQVIGGLIAAGGVAAVGGGIIVREKVNNLLDAGRNTTIAPVGHNEKNIFSASYGSNSSTSTPENLHPTPTTTATTEADTTPPPEIQATETPAPVEEEITIGDANLAEHFLGEVFDALYQRRHERAQQDPAFAERVTEQMRQRPEINLLLLGIDQARWRQESWANYGEAGYGNNDVTILLSFNPHTFQLKIYSFPRDLFSPEVQAFRYEHGADPTKHDAPVRRINGITAYTKMNADDQINMANRVIESATGLPVDGIVKCNMDFVVDFLVEMCPDGLTVNVPKTFQTTHILGDTQKTYTFVEGRQTLTGDELLAFARTRKEAGGSDDSRGDNQREIVQAFIVNYGTRLISDFVIGRTDNLELLAAVIDSQQSEQKRNLFSSLGISQILLPIIARIDEYRSNKDKGIAILAALGANTPSLISGDTLQNIGIGNHQTDSGPLVHGIRSMYAPSEEEERLARIDRGLRYLAGSKVDVNLPDWGPTNLGNYLKYWQPLRDLVASMLQAA